MRFYSAFILVAAFLSGASAFADLGGGLALVETTSTDVLNKGESVADFAVRIKSEITCEAIPAKLREYQQTRVDLDRSVRDSFGAVSRSLDHWDAELWNLSGRPFRYTGALGAYARRVDQYAADLGNDQTKLQIFIAAIDAKLAECGSPKP